MYVPRGRRDPWYRGGLYVGFSIGFCIAAVGALNIVLGNLFSDSGSPISAREVLQAILLLIFAPLAAGALLGLSCGGFALLFGRMLAPVLVALFCRPETFERCYPSIRIPEAVGGGRPFQSERRGEQRGPGQRSAIAFDAWFKGGACLGLALGLLSGIVANDAAAAIVLAFWGALLVGWVSSGIGQALKPILVALFCDRETFENQHPSTETESRRSRR